MPVGTPLTSPEAVEAALVRSLTDAEREFIDALIDQASTKLRALMPAVDGRMDSYGASDVGLDPDLVASVLADVIARRLLNPRRLWSAGGESAGPFTEASETYPGSRGGSSEAFGNLTITPADLAQLAPSSGFAMPGTIWTRPHWEC